MSNSMMSVSKNSFPTLLNGETILASRFKFLCMMNDYIDGSSWGGCQSSAQRKVDKEVREWSEREIKPKYIINCQSNLKADRPFSLVLSPKPEFNGTTCEYLEELDEVGLLLVDDKRNFYIETDLEVIETLRRELEMEGMRNKTRWIGFEGAKSTEDCQNPELYLASLKKLDLENGGMVTRGFTI